MKVQIFTSVVNRPDFVEIQEKLFKKFFLDEYQFNVVDDSIDDQISKEFEDICKNCNIVYYRKQQDLKRKKDPAIAGTQHATETIQWTFDEIIKKKHTDSIVLFCDSDMFLLDDFSAKDYMKDEVIAGSLQVRGHVKYIWNGLMLFNMPKIMSIDSNLDFSGGNVDGEMTDIGGNLHYYFGRNNVKFKNINAGGTTPDDCPEYPSEYNGIQLQDENFLLTDQMWTKPQGGFNFELHLGGKFLHYRAGTNWHTQSSWKSKEDPLKVKAQIFNQIIGDFI